MTNKYICVHGHFYQPPREDPWTGAVEAEPSAAPFHDWNERIAKECYEANTRAPILNPKGEVTRRVNNFSLISFDIGPTLLSWIRRHNPDTYDAILDADRESVRRNGGHGNALAQAYNHLIMPLASRRDKVTQVLWGVRDFEFHYRRRPEGFWLPETAVDRETLEILADCGIGFTVLAPHQAYRRRRIGFNSRWEYLRHECVDPRHAYRILLDGRHFHVFFYDGGISRAIAFDGLLYNGDNLVNRLMGAFMRRDRTSQLVSTATDGESFGHHHPFGEMAVAYGLKKVEALGLAEITNFAAFLDRTGSPWEVDIYENSSWSCSHGVERWRSDCGCRLSHEAGWNQKWRSPLREGLDTLKERLDRAYETVAGLLLKDPWQARNDYIDVLLEADTKRRFLAGHARGTIDAAGQAVVFDLLESQKYAMFMFTSCGWFFDDISGIEARYVLKFAKRAIQLAAPYAARDLEQTFIKKLAQAKSNLPGKGTGADIYNGLEADHGL